MKIENATKYYISPDGEAPLVYEVVDSWEPWPNARLYKLTLIEAKGLNLTMGSSMIALQTDDSMALHKLGMQDSGNHPDGLLYPDAHEAAVQTLKNKLEGAKQALRQYKKTEKRRKAMYEEMWEGWSRAWSGPGAKFTTTTI